MSWTQLTHAGQFLGKTAIKAIEMPGDTLVLVFKGKDYAIIHGTVRSAPPVSTFEASLDKVFKGKDLS